MLEKVPTDEAQQIMNIAELTIEQLRYRYPGERRVLRGVHAKDHGCVYAAFHVLPDLPDAFRYGVFATPGRSYSALVRFSNASTVVAQDSTPGENGGPPAHGSRGMAVKLLGVEGTPLPNVHGALTQDFLMINQPVFAFANVEDYEVLSQVLLETLKAGKEDPGPFFARRLPAAGSGTPPTTAQLRALNTLKLIQRIRSSTSDPVTGAFQPPPSSPLDNDYFSASPFLLGQHQVMRFRIRPRSRSMEEPDVRDPNYLRTALTKRLTNPSMGDVIFDFEVQVRPTDSIDPELHIENASQEWPESEAGPFHPVATLTIPLQETDTPERRVQCERLVFTPWHGLEDHRPLGGINRLRRAVYEASSMFRNLPKEPSGCSNIVSID
jgi:hypothetical protein